MTSYVAATAERLVADGCTVTTEEWPDGPVLVGYRADFNLLWLATRLHLFTYVQVRPRVTAADIREYTATVFNQAVCRKGQWRGFQSGVAVLACLVTASAEPEAAIYARERQRLRFAAMARPVIVDTTHGIVSAYRGTPAIGVLYAKHLRNKIETYFPGDSGEF